MCGRKVYPIQTSLIRIKVFCIGTRSNVDTTIKHHASEYTQQIDNGQIQPNIVHSHVNGHVSINSDTGLNAEGGYEQYSGEQLVALRLSAILCRK